MYPTKVEPENALVTAVAITTNSHSERKEPEAMQITTWMREATKMTQRCPSPNNLD